MGLLNDEGHRAIEGSSRPLLVNLTVSMIPPAWRGRSMTPVGAGGWWPDPQLD